MLTIVFSSVLLLHLPQNRRLGLFFYNIFLSLYGIGIQLAAFSTKKAAARLSGTKNIFNELAHWGSQHNAAGKLVWMHCASLGEFEQGRPVIEKIKAAYPGYKILVTFFSPSGYEIKKDYPEADGVFYLPADGKRNAGNFIEILKPSLVIWVKYEYWYYYLTALREKNISVLLISAIFREDQPFFKYYGGIWKKMLGCFSQIFVQNEESMVLLNKISLGGKAAVAGDTRFDRVTDNAEKMPLLPEKLIQFCEGNRVIVAGSTWEEDEEEIVHYVKIHQNYKFIIAPHEPGKERLREAKILFGDSIFYSEFIAGNETPQVIIIDNVGMLSALYSLADVCFIGGGFNDSGIHNILEAAVFGKPVIFGPEYEKFQEATDLVKAGGAFSIKTALELEAAFDKLLNDPLLLHQTGTVCKNYIYQNKGAADKILQYIQANRLLIS